MGKLSGAGIPPAREIIPGRETTFRISRMALTPMLRVRQRKIGFGKHSFVFSLIK